MGNLETPDIILRPIGYIRTPFSSSAGMPIQGAHAPGAEGWIELFPEFAQGIRDLEGFERIWLAFYFHRAISFQLMVRPFLDTVEHGIFATRAPARPNPIGITAVRLLRIEGLRLRIADVDMIDQTPLLDIKPYVPDFDRFDAVRIGWYNDVLTAGTVADDRFESKER
jgi:tRNA-Thr(GGU) m(6)t(6)A37 methyltransferase TsaA